MHDHLEPVHLPDYAEEFNTPYTAAIKVHAGKSVFISGVSAAPVYHHHPQTQLF